MRTPHSYPISSTLAVPCCRLYFSGAVRSRTASSLGLGRKVTRQEPALLLDAVEGTAKTLTGMLVEVSWCFGVMKFVLAQRSMTHDRQPTQSD